MEIKSNSHGKTTSKKKELISPRESDMEKHEQGQSPLLETNAASLEKHGQGQSPLEGEKLQRGSSLVFQIIYTAVREKGWCLSGLTRNDPSHCLRVRTLKLGIKTACFFF
jgi:hypothetical protein